eukprot:gene25136-31555_t
MLTSPSVAPSLTPIQPTALPTNVIYQSTLSQIKTLAGTGVPGWSGDGVRASSALLNAPRSVWRDTVGNTYLTEFSGHRVRKILASSDTLLTLAGNGTSSFSGDGGSAKRAQVNSPRQIMGDSVSSLYIVDNLNYRTITSIAGNGLSNTNGGDTGPATSVWFSQLFQLYGDTNSQLYMAETGKGRIRVVNLISGMLSTLAGTGTPQSGDLVGVATSTGISPNGVWCDANGNIVFSDYSGARVKNVSTAGIILILLGTGSSVRMGDGGPPTSTAIIGPQMLFIDTGGELYLAASGEHSVRKLYDFAPTQQPTIAPTSQPSFYVNALSQISTFAGSGVSGNNGDGGLATSATVTHPCGSWQDSAGNVYLSDMDANNIRKISADTGLISTLTISGVSPALISPRQIVGDTSNSLFIADCNRKRIIKVDLSVMVYTLFAGSGGTTSSGNGGQATSAELNGPEGVFKDSAGNVYIAESGGNVIRRVLPSGIISTFAGQGPSYAEGVPATSSQMYNPTQLWANTAGSVYVALFGVHRIRCVNSATMTVTTTAGTGTAASTNIAGPGTSTNINNPGGVAGDGNGVVYFLEYAGKRVKRVAVDTRMVITAAGTGASPTGAGAFCGDGGPPTSALFITPLELSVSTLGDIYVSDYGMFRFRKISGFSPTTSPSVAPTPSPSFQPSYFQSDLTQIGTRVGTGASSGNVANGAATSFTLNGPRGVWADSVARMYISDTGANKIRKVGTMAGSITLIAGSISLSGPRQIHGEMDNINLYVADFSNHRIATSALLVNPTQIFIDTTGNTMWFAAADQHKIKTPTTLPSDSPTNVPSSAPTSPPTATPTLSLTPSRLPTLVLSFTPTAQPTYYLHDLNQVGTFAGSGVQATSGDNGPATSAAVNIPQGVWGDPQGNMYVSEVGGSKVRKITAGTQIITSLVVTGYTSLASVFGPQGVWCDTRGNLYLSEGPAHYVRRVNSTTNIIGAVAGTGMPSSSGGGGQATSAGVNNPSQIMGDTNSRLYIAELNGNSIRWLNLISVGSSTGDNGPATSATINRPSGLWVDSIGNVYVAETVGNVIRLVATDTRTVTTVAGVIGSSGVSGDGGAAISALLDSPRQLFADQGNRLHVALFNSFKIRKIVLSSGIIVAVAGSGSKGSTTATGPATSTSFTELIGVWGDAGGGLYISDMSSDRLFKWTSGIVSHLAGIGVSNASSLALNGDGGRATSATISKPMQIFVSSVGDLYLADYNNEKIRKI